MADYTFGDVLRHNNLTRNQLNRWVQAGLIRPVVVEGQRLRHFTARNLVEAAVCDELRGFGLSEVLSARVIKALNVYWDQPDAPIDERPNAPTVRDCPILWIGFVRFTLGADDELHEDLLIRLTDLATIGQFLTGPAGEGVDDGAESGIAIPLHRLIRDLETKTGDHFDFTPAPTPEPVAPPPPSADVVDRLTQDLTAKFTKAMTAVLQITTGDAPLADDQRAAIARAIQDAFQSEPES